LILPNIFFQNKISLLYISHHNLFYGIYFFAHRVHMGINQQKSKKKKGTTTVCVGGGGGGECCSATAISCDRATLHRQRERERESLDTTSFLFFFFTLASRRGWPPPTPFIYFIHLVAMKCHYNTLYRTASSSSSSCFLLYTTTTLFFFLRSKSNNVL
jgi:hypothetical protein